MKRYNWEQAQLQHMKVGKLEIFIFAPKIQSIVFLPKNAFPSIFIQNIDAQKLQIIYPFQDYVARFGHGSAKLARQAQSKEKTMAKMIAGGLTEKAVAESVKFEILEI